MLAIDHKEFGIVGAERGEFVELLAIGFAGADEVREFTAGLGEFIRPKSKTIRGF